MRDWDEENPALLDFMASLGPNADARDVLGPYLKRLDEKPLTPELMPKVRRAVETFERSTGQSFVPENDRVRYDQRDPNSLKAWVGKALEWFAELPKRGAKKKKKSKDEDEDDK